MKKKLNSRFCMFETTGNDRVPVPGSAAEYSFNIRFQYGMGGSA
jgi:hypothetical protein